MTRSKKQLLNRILYIQYTNPAIYIGNDLPGNYRDSHGLFTCSGILFNHESPLRRERFVTQKIIATTCPIAQGSQEKLYLGNRKMQFL
jgi:GDP-D-mannose dehydratase